MVQTVKVDIASCVTPVEPLRGLPGDEPDSVVVGEHDLRLQHRSAAAQLTHKPHHAL
jgi:hypothetical protein